MFRAILITWLTALAVGSYLESNDPNAIYYAGLPALTLVALTLVKRAQK